ncbi:MAG: hypothetical protein ACKVS9_05480 [Phycisphaerae bacterium]
MNHATAINESDSVGTLNPGVVSSHATPSEARYADERVRVARSAIRRSLSGIGATVANVFGIRSNAGAHPWIFTGSTVAVGALAGAWMSRPRGNASEQRGRVEPQPGVQAAAMGQMHAGADSSRAVHGLLLSIAGTVVGAAVPLLLQAWVGSRAANGPSQKSAAETNCHDGEWVARGVDMHH